MGRGPQTGSSHFGWEVVVARSERSGQNSRTRFVTVRSLNLRKSQHSNQREGKIRDDIPSSGCRGSSGDPRRGDNSLVLQDGWRQNQKSMAANAESGATPKPAVMGDGACWETPIYALVDFTSTPNAAWFRRHRFNVDSRQGCRFELDLRARTAEHPACYTAVTAGSCVTARIEGWSPYNRVAFLHASCGSIRSQGCGGRGFSGNRATELSLRGFQSASVRAALDQRD
jgi:hypothetical protein